MYGRPGRNVSLCVVPMKVQGGLCVPRHRGVPLSTNCVPIKVSLGRGVCRGVKAYSHLCLVCGDVNICTVRRGECGCVCTLMHMHTVTPPTLSLENVARP